MSWIEKTIAISVLIWIVGRILDLAERVHNLEERTQEGEGQ